MAHLCSSTRFPMLWNELTAKHNGFKQRRYNFMLVSDLDHTMVQNEDKGHQHLLDFGRQWVSGLGLSSALIYATGRSPALYKAIWAQAPLLTPQVLICSVGTEIFKLHRQESVSASLHPQVLCSETAGGPVQEPAAMHRLEYRPDTAWLQHLNADGWDRDKVLEVAAHFPQLKLQVPSEQRPHKVSFKLQSPSAQEAPQGTQAPEGLEGAPGHGEHQQLSPAAMLQRLEEALKAQQLNTRVIYSGGVDVDIIPSKAGKGKALHFLIDELRSARQQAGATAECCLPELGIQVCGDSGNDIDMMEVPGVNVCAVGRDPQLLEYVSKRTDKQHVHLASAPCAGGILEAMGHFGTTSAPALQQPQSRTLDAVAAVVQQLGAFLALSVVPAADIGSDATEDVARIDTGSPPQKDKGSRNVTVAVAHVGTGLASAVPVGGLLLELSDGLELRQEHVQERPSFVDLLELQLQLQDGGKACGVAAHQARALFQVFTLLADGTRDLASAVTCTANLEMKTNAHGLPSVICSNVHVCSSSSFTLP